jgi:hypothetical protein
MSIGEQIAAAAREQAARDPDAHAARGGFVPRIGHGTADPYPNHSEMGAGETARTNRVPFTRPLEPWEGAEQVKFHDLSREV